MFCKLQNKKARIKRAANKKKKQAKATTLATTLATTTTATTTAAAAEQRAVKLTDAQCIKVLEEYVLIFILLLLAVVI